MPYLVGDATDGADYDGNNGRHRFEDDQRRTLGKRVTTSTSSSSMSARASGLHPRKWIRCSRARCLVRAVSSSRKGPSPTTMLENATPFFNR